MLVHMPLILGGLLCDAFVQVPSQTTLVRLRLARMRTVKYISPCEQLKHASIR